MTRENLITLLRQSQASNETICNVMHVWNEVKTPTRLPDMNKVMADCVYAVGTTVEAAKSLDKHAVNVRARFLFISKLANGYLYPLAEIGEFLGERHHTTIIHARDKFNSLVEHEDPISIRDLQNLQRVESGLRPVYFVPKTIVSKPPKVAVLIYEKNTDRYFRSAKSLKAFYGMSKSSRINWFRFVRRVIPTSKISEIDLVEI